MPPEIAFIALAGLGTTSFIIWTAARVYLRKLELGHQRQPAGLDDVIEQRLERIEQAVDAIAIEMERVSEGQRFTTKLLAERATPPRANAPGGVPRADTPH